MTLADELIHHHTRSLIDIIRFNDIQYDASSSTTSPTQKDCVMSA